MNKIKTNIPESLNLKGLLKNLKKILWFFIMVLIAFNVVLFYFLYGWLYFVGLIIWNVLFVWGSVPVMIWIWKSILVDKWMEVADEVKEKFSKENIVKVVKKK